MLKLIRGQTSHQNLFRNPSNRFWFSFPASFRGERHREPHRQAQVLADRQLPRLQHRLCSGAQPHISQQEQVPFWRPGGQRTRHHDQETTFLHWWVLDLELSVGMADSGLGCNWLLEGPSFSISIVAKFWRKLSCVGSLLLLNQGSTCTSKISGFIVSWQAILFINSKV